VGRCQNQGSGWPGRLPHPSKTAATRWTTTRTSASAILSRRPFTALAILEKDAFQFSATDLHDTYRRLQDLFCEEFNPDPDHPPAYIVRKTVKAFIDNAILVPHPVMPDTYNLSSEGFRKLVFFAGYVEPFLESYRTALVYFAKNRRNQHPFPKKVDTVKSKLLIS
jgi:glycerol-3-phosphate O-acyltransferase